MDKLRKVLKLFMILLFTFILLVLLIIWSKISFDQIYMNIILTLIMVTLAIVVFITAIVSFSQMIKYAKKDSKAFIKTLLGRFILPFIILLVINYIKDRNLDIQYAIMYSSMITIISFYSKDGRFN